MNWAKNGQQLRTQLPGKTCLLNHKEICINYTTGLIYNKNSNQKGWIHLIYVCTFGCCIKFDIRKIISRLRVLLSKLMYTKRFFLDLTSECRPIEYSIEMQMISTTTKRKLPKVKLILTVITRFLLDSFCGHSTFTIETINYSKYGYRSRLHRV